MGYYYEIYRKELKPEFTTFEKILVKAYEILKINLEDKKLDRELFEAGFSAKSKHFFNAGILVSLLSTPISILIAFFGKTSTSLYMAISLPLLGLSIGFFLPHYLVQIRKMEIIGQSPLAILYLVIAMEVTPNLESAVEFAAKNMPNPLGRIFRRLLWLVESRNALSMKDAFFSYSSKIKGWAPHFADALYLVASSVSEYGVQRKKTLEKALSVALEGTRSYMENFARSLSLPAMVINAFGVLLPVLMLILAPMSNLFTKGNVGPTIAIFYDFFIPMVLAITVIYVLGKRPGSMSRIKYKKPSFKLFGFDARKLAFLIFLVFFTLQMLVAVGTHFTVFAPSLENGSNPVFATTPLIISLGIPLGIIAYAFARENMELKKRVRELESLFANALYQLASAMREGLPMEQAIGFVAERMKGTEVEYFFKLTYDKIQRLGYPLRKAILDEKAGTIRLFPSDIIKSVMLVLVESAEKGPSSAAMTAAGISNYLRNLQQVQEKIIDILADQIQSFNFQATVLIPLISGAIVGLNEIISLIILKISHYAVMSTGLEAVGTFGFVSNLLNISGVIQPSFMQLVVGIFMILLSIILGVFVGGLEDGWDLVSIASYMGRFLIFGTIFYTIIAILVSGIFGSMLRGVVV